MTVTKTYSGSTGKINNKCKYRDRLPLLQEIGKNEKTDKDDDCRIGDEYITVWS